MTSASEIVAHENSSSALPAHHAFLAQRWAGFWARVAAQIVDGLVLMIPLLGLGAGAAYLFGIGKEPPFSPGASLLTQLVIFTLYAAWLNSSVHRGTVGRRAVGVAVVSANNGERVSFAVGMARGVLSLLSGMLIFPNLLQLFTPRRQSLADLLTGTVVVQKGQAGRVVIVTIVLAALVFFCALSGLAIFGIEAFENWQVQNQVTQAMSLCREYELLVIQNADGQNTDLSQGFTAPAPTVNVESIDLSPAGVIAVHMSHANNDVRFTLSPNWSGNGLAATTAPPADSTLVWTCRVTSKEKNSSVPVECRR